MPQPPRHNGRSAGHPSSPSGRLAYIRAPGIRPPARRPFRPAQIRPNVSANEAALHFVHDGSGNLTFEPGRSGYCVDDRVRRRAKRRLPAGLRRASGHRKHASQKSQMNFHFVTGYSWSAPIGSGARIGTMFGRILASVMSDTVPDMRYAIGQSPSVRPARNDRSPTGHRIRRTSSDTIARPRPVPGFVSSRRFPRFRTSLAFSSGMPATVILDHEFEHSHIWSWAPRPA